MGNQAYSGRLEIADARTVGRSTAGLRFDFRHESRGLEMFLSLSAACEIHARAFGYIPLANIRDISSDDGSRFHPHRRSHRIDRRIYVPS